MLHHEVSRVLGSKMLCCPARSTCQERPSGPSTCFQCRCCCILTVSCWTHSLSENVAELEWSPSLFQACAIAACCRTLSRVSGKATFYPHTLRPFLAASPHALSHATPCTIRACQPTMRNDDSIQAPETIAFLYVPPFLNVPRS